MTTLPPAARAALGPEQPDPTPERLLWVDVYDAPRMIAMDDPAGGGVLGSYAEFDGALPLTDQMATKARAICDAVDSHACEADSCVDAPPVGVGWVLADDGRTAWASFALVQHGRDVIAVCASCSPTARYGALWRPGA